MTYVFNITPLFGELNDIAAPRPFVPYFRQVASIGGKRREAFRKFGAPMPYAVSVFSTPYAFYTLNPYQKHSKSDPPP